MRKEFRLREEIKTSDAVVVLACGAGLKPSRITRMRASRFPALDTIFLASVERHGRFFEGALFAANACSTEPGGICPHTDCPKGLLNGPCGGVADGRCEVNIENECAWVRIYQRLKAQGRLDVLRSITLPRITRRA